MKEIEAILWDGKSPFSRGARPLLSHYTSLGVIESILSGKEMWLSSPFLMNDGSEFRYVMGVAVSRLRNGIDEGLAESFKENKSAFLSEVNRLIYLVESQEVFGIYAACFNVHDPEYKNGQLSMWRAYGDGGHGGALILKTENMKEVSGTPFIFDQIEYKSQEEVSQLLSSKFLELTQAISNSQTLWVSFVAVAKQLVEWLIVQSLFIKHSDFVHEGEWRLVYRRTLDKAGHFASMEDYSILKSAIQPRLKLNMDAALKVIQGGDDGFLSMIDSVILGPRNASPLNMLAFKRMVKRFIPSLPDQKIVGSQTPMA